MTYCRASGEQRPSAVVLDSLNSLTSHRNRGTSSRNRSLPVSLVVLCADAGRLSVGRPSAGWSAPGDELQGENWD